MEKRTFKVSTELKPFVEKELMRRGYCYESVSKTELKIADINGQKFHYVVKAAKAAKLTEEQGILHVSYQQLDEVGELTRLFNKHHCRGYVLC